VKKVIAAGTAAFGVAVLVVLAIFGLAQGKQSQLAAQSGAGACIIPASGSQPLPPNEARDRNATIWIQQGRAKSIPTRGIYIGLAVILVESNGLNLASRKVPESMSYPNDGVVPGDHLSIGTAQQQVGMGWFDTVENGMKVPVQADAFYSALVNVSGWQVMSFSAAAQSVQRSAFPSRYGQREADAVALYNRLAAAAGTADVVPAVDTGTNVCQEANAGPISVSGRWANPLAPARYYMTSPFGPRIDPVLGIPKPHKGQDLGTDGGTPIYSPCDGVAELVGWDAWGGGNMTTLNCGGDIVIKLMHQSKTLIATGAKVQAGDKIGLVGTTGNSTGNHLHEQVEFKGTPIDPVPFMRDRGVPLCVRAGEANPTHLPSC
jgi:murein DD-endopeptidase MepM/ murein hydrolase activator NlpD